MKLGILIINRNHIAYTIDLIHKLAAQTSKDFELTIIDNGSSERDTRPRLAELRMPFIKEIRYTGKNLSLHTLWNEFVLKNSYEYYSFLNNDMVIPKNFVSDTLEVFNREPSVGCVAHATNHPNYQECKPLEYEIFSDNYRQGWDFTMRREAYSPVPRSLQFFCGDDYLYEKLYQKGWKFAIVASSPIIHFQGATPRVPGISSRDITEYKKLGFKHGRLDVCFKLSNFKPTFSKIVEN
jgi:glycosyltransferase involved in cell wall biosynthesis